MKDFDLIRRAATFATNAHEGQADKNGHPYISHPARVALYVDEMAGGSYAIAAAWLHDVIEDCNVHEVDLLNAGFPEQVIDLVTNLTKVRGEPRSSYRQRVMSKPASLLVKIADIKDNTDPARLAQLPGEVSKRLIAKYAEDMKVFEAAPGYKYLVSVG